MAITLEQLRAFALVAEHGSISRAAEARHLSQPALSSQLRQLASAFGARLYTRHHRGVTLTEAGRRLLPHAQAALRALQGARGLSSALSAGTSGSVRIAASMTVAVYYLPPVLTAFRRARPDVQVQLLTRNSHDAFELLLNGAADLALVEGLTPPPQPDLEQHAIADDEIVLAVPPDHWLADRTRLEPGDLAGMELVQRERGSGTRDLVELALAQVPDTRIAIEATGIEAVKEAILGGLAVGFISRIAIRREVELGMLKELTVASPALQRKITVVHPVTGLRTQHCEELLKLLDEPLDLRQGLSPRR